MEAIKKSQAIAIFKELKVLNIIDQNNRIVNFDASKEIKIAGYEAKEVFIKSVLSDKFNKLSDRASKAQKLANKNLRVELAEHTFEYELITAADYNAELIAKIYNKMHSDNYVDPSADKFLLAADILKKLKSNKDKSVLAENLVYVLENHSKTHKGFTVPLYLTNAIRWVIDKKV